MAARSQTPYVARVESVFVGRTGRSVRVTCPFLCEQRSHVHPWRRAEPHPSAEVLAPCSPPGELSTYAIDPLTAHEQMSAANAGQKRAPQAKAAKS